MSYSLYIEKMKDLINHAKKYNERYPFAAMIINEDTKEEICRGVNEANLNPTLHGEIVAINNFVKLQVVAGLDSSKLTLITTAEPCPMCQSAIIWTGLKKVVYGTSIKTLIKKGWNQIDISSIEVSLRSNSIKPEVIPGVLKEETDPLFMDMSTIS